MSRLRKMIIAGVVIALIGMGTYHFLIKDHKIVRGAKRPQRKKRIKIKMIT